MFGYVHPFIAPVDDLSSNPNPGCLHDAEPLTFVMVFIVGQIVQSMARFVYFNEAFNMVLCSIEKRHDENIRHKP